MTLDHPPISDKFLQAAEPARPTRTRAKNPPPFSLRLSADEKAELVRQAGKTPLGAYIRSRLLGDTAAPRRTYRQPVADEQALARLLSELGKARLSSNLNQLAKAANTGSLPVGPDTERALVEACEDVRRMRHALIAALGLRSDP